MPTAPYVMISSTFYDLRQVRADLEAFLRDQAGCVPLLSESASFPVEPSQEAIENCRRRVEKDADLLILVVGGRYGSIEQKSGKSVTNLEYLAARAKGIPIYCFIEKGLLANLPVWKANPEADYSSVVDNPKVFDFVNQVRSVDSVWTHEFELAQDIVKVLRHQFAHLLLEGLKWQMRLRDDSTSRLLDELQGEALRLAVERPSGWGYRLFSGVLSGEIETSREARDRMKMGLSSGPLEWISPESFREWGLTRMAEFQALMDNLKEVMEGQFSTSFRSDGGANDLSTPIFLARQIGHLYREALLWARKVRAAGANDLLRPLVEAESKLVDDFLEKIEVLPAQITGAWEAAVKDPAKSEETIVLSLELEPDSKPLMEELRKLEVHWSGPRADRT
jgi:Domain of unknown function (DUF4062)